MSCHHNLWATHAARIPRPGNYAAPDVDPQGASFDFRNNVFYNWGGSRSGYNADTQSLARYKFVANAYLPVIERNTTSGFHLVFRWIHIF